jgi:hypothetical protein
LQQVGIEIRRFNKEELTEYDLVDLDIGLYNHHSNVDILKYSINDDNSSRFLARLNDVLYKLIDISSPLAPPL